MERQTSMDSGRRPHFVFKAAMPGTFQLIFAHIIVAAENILRIFARPLLLAGGFIALAWLGVFNSLYPWVHLAALVIFLVLFIGAIGRAGREWRPLGPSPARRRVEEASGLSHRPLDVLEDRPATSGAAQNTLWQMHKTHAEEQTRKLRWPKWKLSFANRDPFALRYALLILLVIGVLSGWGALGGRLIAAINPAVGKLAATAPALDAWITPPEYTHLPPIMIATPAGPRHDGDVIEVPEGSILSAHMAEHEGTVPTMNVNDQETVFKAPESQDFEATETITGGDTISIRRGWQRLGSWHIKVIPDSAPQIALTESPSVTERKSVRIPFQASDDYGVTAISLRIVPRESLPGADDTPIEVPLATPEAKDVKRVSFEDLTAHPWAGQGVQMQLIATDAAGHRTMSESFDFTLPERSFLNPIARALSEERKKLLSSPFDELVRTEAANVMAGIAHQPLAYRGDPLVLLALRSGAVRLVLDRSREAAVAVNDILWQSAVRVEDGSVGLAEQTLRQAQKDLADALDSNASEEDIQRLIERLHQALAQYLAELSTRMAAKPGPIEDLSQFLGPQTNVLTPQDLEHMLDRMRNLSASGAREAALAELAQLQQTLESLRTAQPSLSESQRMALLRLKALHELTHGQQALLDQTFQSAHGGKAQNRPLEMGQKGLLQQLQKLMGDMKGADTHDLAHGADAMRRAGNDLQQNAPGQALQPQNEALAALQKAEAAMMNELRQSMFMMPQTGSSDPFGRRGGFARDDGGIKVPERLEAQHVREILNELQRRAGDMLRPKSERDYIDRLLQNF